MASFDVWVGGFVWSHATCEQFAADGYVISGFIVMYRFVLDVELTPFKEATPGSRIPIAPINAPLWSVVIGTAPLNAAISPASNGINHGSVVQCETQLIVPGTITDGT